MIDQAIISQIANFGFPIVMCLLLYYHSTTTIKENTKVIRELTIMIKGLK